MNRFHIFRDGLNGINARLIIGIFVIPSLPAAVSVEPDNSIPLLSGKFAEIFF